MMWFPTMILKDGTLVFGPIKDRPTVNVDDKDSVYELKVNDKLVYFRLCCNKKVLTEEEILELRKYFSEVVSEWKE